MGLLGVLYPVRKRRCVFSRVKPSEIEKDYLGANFFLRLGGMAGIIGCEI
jgi:hypothetical protein